MIGPRGTIVFVPMKQGLRKLKTFKTALFVALAALVLSTCTAAVSGLQLPRRPAGDGGATLAVKTSELPDDGVGEELAATEPAVPPQAPAEGQPSTPVEQSSPANPPVAGPPVEFKKVKVQQPRLRVTGVPDRETVDRLREVPGVRYATAFDVAQIPVGPKQTPVTVAAVDPQRFRVVTPEVTANFLGVWERLVEGDAAFTHDTGNTLKVKFGVQLGQTVEAGGEGSALRIGAYASNGIPPVADALVSPETAQKIGIQGRRDALIAVSEGADPAVVAQKIRQVANVGVQVIEEPQARRAYLTGADAKNAFEPFNYIEMGDGMIQIDPAWVQRNIVRKRVPILKGEVVCHRLMVDQLYGALAEIEARGLADLIDPSQYGGCWVPRHIDFNPAKPISMHGWGLAADFNVSTNGLGRKPTLDPRIVAVFDRWGFVWGGRWSRPDGMHFELGALVQNSPQG